MNCENKRHMKEYILKIIEKGGEGLVALSPKSQYFSGRSSHFIKLKVIFFFSLLFYYYCD